MTLATRDPRTSTWGALDSLRLLQSRSPEPSTVNDLVRSTQTEEQIVLSMR